MNKYLFLLFLLINSFQLQSNGIQPEGLASQYPNTIDNFGVIGSISPSLFSADDLTELEELFDAFNFSLEWGKNNILVFPDKTNDYLKDHKSDTVPSMPGAIIEYLTLGNALKCAGVLGILYALYKLTMPRQPLDAQAWLAAYTSYNLEKCVAGH